MSKTRESSAFKRLVAVMKDVGNGRRQMSDWGNRAHFFRRHWKVMLIVTCSILLMIALFSCRGLREKAVSIETLQEITAGAEPCRIVFIADLHLTVSSFEDKMVMQLPDMVNALQPDWILLGGDTYDLRASQNREQFLQLFALWIQQFSPRCGIVIVPGDHDPELGTPDWPTAPEIQLLKDESILLAEKIILWGCNYPGAGYEDAEKFEKLNRVLASAPSDAVILCMAHAPEFFDFLPDDSRILQISGDTHGGLIHIPGLPDGILPLCFGRHMKYIKGWYGQQGGKRLFVSTGWGGQGIRGIRFNIPPQIVLIVFSATGV